MEEKNIEKKEDMKSETQEIRRHYENIVLIGFLVIIFIVNFVGFFRQIGSIGNITVLPERQLVYVIIGGFMFFLGVTWILVNIIGLYFYKKWAVILTIIYFIWKFLTFLNITLKNCFCGNDLFNVLVAGFLVYLSFAYLKHPFYNQKKVEEKV